VALSSCTVPNDVLPQKQHLGEHCCACFHLRLVIRVQKYERAGWKALWGPEEEKGVRGVSLRVANRKKWQEKWFAAKLFLCAGSRRASSGLCLLSHPTACTITVLYFCEYGATYRSLSV